MEILIRSQKFYNNISKNRIKELRTIAGIGPTELKKLTGLSRTTIWELENNRLTIIDCDKWDKIAEILGRSPEELLGDTMEVGMRIADNIKGLRESKGLSREDVANQCECNISEIENIESGKKASVGVLRSLAQVLDVSYSALLCP